MLYLSKSKYCNLWQCPKLLWLNKFKPEEKTEDPSLQARFDEGNAVGDLAMGLFGDFVEVTSFKEDGRLDLDKMCKLTQKYIGEGARLVREVFELAKEKGFTVDKEGYKAAEQAHIEKSKAGSEQKFACGLADHKICGAQGARGEDLA